MEIHPKVFISYSHDDEETSNRVLKFSNKLRREGIDANIDQYEESPIEGWPLWMENQIEKSDYIIVVCSKQYYDKIHNLEKNAGKGVSWEAKIIYQSLYDCKQESNKFIPVLLNSNDVEFIPKPLKIFTFYELDKDYTKLFNRLCNIKSVDKPPIGKMHSLPHKDRKTIFLSTPINLSLWDKAKWKGIMYLHSVGRPPVIGLLFREYKTGLNIFTKWKEAFDGTDFDEILSISFIEPPFPKGSYINSSPEYNYSDGYFVHIGPNVIADIKKLESEGYDTNNIVISTISRYIWMDSKKGDQKRELFRKQFRDSGCYFVAPVGLKDFSKNAEDNDNIIFDVENGIKMSKIRFMKGTEIRGNDLEQAVLENRVVKK